jgi:hypothetical protein
MWQVKLVFPKWKNMLDFKMLEERLAFYYTVIEADGQGGKTR